MGARRPLMTGAPDLANSSLTTTRRVDPSPALAVVMQALSVNRLYLIVSLTFIVGSGGVGWIVGWIGPVGVTQLYAQTLFMTGLMVLGRVLSERMRPPFRDTSARESYVAIAKRLRSGMLSNERLASFAMVALTLPLVVATYTGWKIWLNEVHHFSHDALFATLDSYLHGGRQPWEVLQPALGFRWVTRTLDVVYLLVWMVALHFVTVWYALSPPSVSRSKFLTASALAWPVAGVGLNALFLAAGPCFYAAVVGGSSPYEPLTAYLHSIGSIASVAQETLWSMHIAHEAGLAGGIGAMPSMHLVMATLVAAGVSGWGRVWRVAGVCFVVVILVGSVHLGWHYAVDGYVGISVGYLLWRAAGWLPATQAARSRSTVARAPVSRRRVSTNPAGDTPIP